MADPHEESRHDRNQLKFQVADLQADVSRHETSWRADHDELVRLRAQHEAHVEADEAQHDALEKRIGALEEAGRAVSTKGEGRMWAVILLAVNTAISAGGAVLMYLAQRGGK